MTLYSDISRTVGKTPLAVLQQEPAGLLAKIEFSNPLSSVKDRIGRAMVEDALEKGKIRPGSTLVEPTSGNTGISLAFMARVHRLNLILTMPESMSLERRRLLTHLGAELVLTPAAQGMKGAIEKAHEILESRPDAFMPDQFSNPANPRVHQDTTGPEIWEDTRGGIDIFVAGVGTGGTISGVSRFIKPQKPGLVSIAVEPAASPVISGGQPGPHKIQGIGAGFIPKNLDQGMVDEIIQVENQDAISAARQLALDHGILCGISSGANYHAARQVALRPENNGKTIVFMACDTGERYLSTDLFAAP